MRINLIAIGERMPSWVNAGFDDYARRIRGCRFELTEIAASKRTKHVDLKRAIRDEENRLRRAIHGDTHVVALDRKGQPWSTEHLAEKMNSWRQVRPDVALLIGGPEGFSHEMLQEADETWSLSALTFAHPLVRVIIAEQVYRAWSILEGLPYHR